MPHEFFSGFKIESRAPAKLILSGEHSVLYGGPAIASAVDYCARTRISVGKNDSADFQKFSKKLLSIRLEDMKTNISGTFSMFCRVKDRLFNSYKKFLTGKKSIRDLLSHPSELFQFAVGTLIDSCYLELKENLDIRLSSTIPIGCGMGSSAAVIVSFIQALTHYFRISKENEWLERVILEIERLQHGRSSGLDTYISLHGGVVQYNLGQKPVLLNQASCQFLRSLPFWIVHTGKPESSTGECVEYIQKGKYGKPENSLWNDFRDVTRGIYTAIESQDFHELKRLISYNHGLLHTLGVVPEKVQSFVKKAEKFGLSLKTTGAGAIRGMQGGMILGLGTHPPKSLLDEYGYEIARPVQLAFSGAEVHSE